MPSETPVPETASDGALPAGQYTVRRGDTLYSIATAHGTSTAVLSALNGLSDADTLREGQVLRLPEAGAEQIVRHVVAAGDTLSRLARRYGTTASAIAEANPDLPNPERLSVGQVLVIPAGKAPAGRTHTVRAGESLYRIAQQYGVTVESIVAANQLRDAGQVMAGRVLVIP